MTKMQGPQWRTIIMNDDKTKSTSNKKATLYNWLCNWRWTAADNNIANLILLADCDPIAYEDEINNLKWKKVMDVEIE